MSILCREKLTRTLTDALHYISSSPLDIHRRWMVTRQLLLLLTVCSASFAQENTGTVSQPLINGTLAGAATEERLGLIGVSSPIGSCSGSLLNNDWAATAAHCVSPATASNPAQLSVTTTWGTGVPGSPATQIIQAAAIYRFWGADTPKTPSDEPVYDIALIRLQTPVVVNGSPSSFIATLSGRSLLDMKGKNVRTFGRGASAYASFNPAGQPVPIVFDNPPRFRSGDFTVDQTDLLTFSYPPKNHQMTGPGDSGGPTYEIMGDGSLRLAGVHSSADVG
jgi:hypothetical protein